jgi:hypothetical protein
MRIIALPRRANQIAAPFLICAVALVFGCSDFHDATGIVSGVHETHSSDDLVGDVISGIIVRNELRLRVATETRSFVSTSTVTQPIVSFLPPDDASMTLGTSVGETTLNVAQDDSTMLSIAFLRDPTTGVPTYIRVFENGRLRYAVRPKYARSGTGWIRQSSDVSLYDAKGDSLGVAHTETVASSVRTLTPADALQSLRGALLPSELPAIIGPACLSAKVNYAVASLALAAAISAVMAAAAECGATIVSCPAMGTATLMFNAALGAWNAALDRLIAACGYDGGGTANGRIALK